LPDNGPVSGENVDLVRRLYESLGGPDPERSLAFFHPDIEFDARRRPDGKVWHGVDGVRQAMIEWTGAWEDWELEAEDYRDADPESVLVLWREQGRGKGSGAQMSQRGANLFTVRDGRIVRVELYLSQQDALKAVGLDS
jgi:ketosteroid isomerase-like protein